MTEPTELLPCPFCGAAAHFEMDEGRWEWVECESCGMQGNRSASLMEDCKPKLAEEWNRRTPQPTQPQAGAVPMSHEDAKALVRQLVASLEGYRRNHNDTQPCDAERAGRAWLEGKP